MSWWKCRVCRGDNEDELHECKFCYRERFLKWTPKKASGSEER